MLTQLIPTISRLNKLALKKIFEGLLTSEEKELEEGIDQQMRKKDLTPYERQEINYIVTALIRNEKGEFDKHKELVKKHNLDYTKLYRRGL